MRIVLLGATGFVGRHLLAELAARGHDCVVLCRQATRCRELALVPGVELRQVLGLDADTLAAALRGAGAVINLVGILNESGRRGKGFRQAHVVVVQNLLQACARSGVRRLLHVSALNAGRGESLYLRSKGEAEALIRNCPDVDATLFRPSVIFGAGDAFFNRFAVLLKLLPVLPLACPGARLQPVYVGDVAGALAEALARPGTVGQTLELAGPKVYTLAELVAWTGRTLRLRRRVVGLPDALARLQGRIMDFVPGKPFSSDNYRSLQLDSVSANNALLSLGIKPRSIAAIVPAYLSVTRHQARLDRFRRQAGRG